MKDVFKLLLIITAFGGFYYYLNSSYVCEAYKKTYGDYEFNIKIDTFYAEGRYLIFIGINSENKAEKFVDNGSYLFQRKYLFSKGDTLIKKKGEVFFELRKYLTGEKKIIEITCK